MSEGRKRGAPRKSPANKRTEKLVISLTPNEMEKVNAAAGAAQGGPFQTTKWVRHLILSQIGFGVDGGVLGNTDDE